MGSNLTVQSFLNRGFKPVGQANLIIPNVATAIPDLLVPVNAILLKNADDISGGGFVYIGNSTLVAGQGYPLFDYNGGAQPSNTKENFFLTDTPSSFYLISNFAIGLNIRVLYLAFND